MVQVRKYSFDKEFGPDGAVVRDASRRFSVEEVEVERKAAYERGKQDSIAQAEHKIAAALEALASAAVASVSRLDAEARAIRGEAAKIALAASRKIAGEALARFGEDRAAAAVEAALDALRHQPRLLVRLPPDSADALRPRIENICLAQGYESAVLVRADAGLGAGAVSIDWTDGVVAIDPKEIAQRIESLIDSALAAPGNIA